MKQIAFMVFSMFAVGSFAGREYNTPLCKELFSAATRVIGRHVVSPDLEMTPIQEMQIVALYTSMALPGENPSMFEDEGVVRKTLFISRSNKKYHQVLVTRGDIEISAIFRFDETTPIAFTNNGRCYQE